ncbi:MAG: Undecaprenyl-diphosphatase BcrC [Chloroflexi bacterium OLB14]|nr:MAG: Undecaprenyl-diphosphatase BcrC [Chloroflexi bacterium OLB14]
MNLRNIIELDKQYSTQLQIAEKPGLLRTIAIFFSHSGDSWFWAIALIALWFLGNPLTKKFATIIFFGIGGLAVVVFAIKFFFKRKRPAGDWGSIYRTTDPHSFPSGHAARAFMIAMIATLLLSSGWLVLLFWLWAPLVAFSRVTMGVHYLSDVIVGAILGILVALFGLQIYQPLIDWFFTVTGFSFW